MKTIIFDKDGTLLDFVAFWRPVTDAAIKSVCATHGCAGCEGRILREIGVHDDGIDAKGILCGGTYAEMADVIRTAFLDAGVDADADALHQEVAQAFCDAVEWGEALPTTKDLRAILAALRADGWQLFVVTTDTPPITKKCLAALGVDDLFDAVFCDDGVHPTKPNPALAEWIAQHYGADKARTFMVGDTLTDMRFAANAGIHAVGLACVDGARETLAPHAEFVIASLAELQKILGVGDEV